MELRGVINCESESDFFDILLNRYSKGCFHHNYKNNYNYYIKKRHALKLIYLYFSIIF